TEGQTGVAAERVRRIARELQDGQPGLVIGGGSAGAHTNGTDSLAAILGLNALLDNIDKPGGVLSSASAPLPETLTSIRPLADWQDLAARMNDGREQAVV